MNREQQEMALWREAYRDSHCFLAQERAGGADAAVAEFRKRYPAEPSTPPAVWYDEPPFPRDGKSYPCWVEGSTSTADVYWDDSQWWAPIVGSTYQHPLAGRRVSPIVKPQELPQ